MTYLLELLGSFAIFEKNFLLGRFLDWSAKKWIMLQGVSKSTSI